MNQEIQLTALLVQAAMLLKEARISKGYALKSLEEPVTEKKPLAESTKKWLIEKNLRDMADIDDLLCSVNKVCFQEAKCNDEEVKSVTVEMDEKTKQAVAFLLSKPVLLDKISNMAQQQIDFEKPLEIVDGKLQ